jgi:outer membrane murein-binding lipoprotein Lpp
MRLHTITRILALAGAGLLLAGCASTENKNAGAMGNDSETSTNQGSSLPLNPDAAPGTSKAASGANGSVSRSNPFGLGGAGMNTAN